MYLAGLSESEFSGRQERRKGLISERIKCPFLWSGRRKMTWLTGHRYSYTRNSYSSHFLNTATVPGTMPYTQWVLNNRLWHACGYEWMNWIISRDVQAISLDSKTNRTMFHPSSNYSTDLYRSHRTTGCCWHRRPPEVWRWINLCGWDTSNWKITPACGPAYATGCQARPCQSHSEAQSGVCWYVFHSFPRTMLCRFRSCLLKLLF